MSNLGPIYLLPHYRPIYVLSFTTEFSGRLTHAHCPVPPHPGFHLPFFLENASVKCSGVSVSLYSILGFHSSSYLTCHQHLVNADFCLPRKAVFALLPRVLNFLDFSPNSPLFLLGLICRSLFTFLTFKFWSAPGFSLQMSFNL